MFDVGQEFVLYKNFESLPLASKGSWRARGETVYGFTDGSKGFQNASLAAWAFLVVGGTVGGEFVPRGNVGSKVALEGQELFIGGTAHTNNEAEKSAIVWFVLWAFHSKFKGCILMIASDGEVSIKLAQGIYTDACLRRGCG